MLEETVTRLSSLLPNLNLLRVDLNGHGKTITGRKSFTLWDQAEDVIALMVSGKPIPQPVIPSKTPMRMRG